MPELLSSKIVVTEETPRIRNLPARSAGILAIVGIFEKGPIGVATLVTSYEDVVEIFGTVTANAQIAPLALRQFFLNGGRRAYVTRTVHYSDLDAGTIDSAAKGSVDLDTDTTSPGPAIVTGSEVGPFALANGDTLKLTYGYDTDTDTRTATIVVTAAAVECANAETYALSDGMTLTVKIDGGAVQTITFPTGDFSNIAAATAEEVAASINKQITGAQASSTTSNTKVTITSDKQGTGSGVEVTGGTSNAALGFSTTPVSGTGYWDTDHSASQFGTIANVKAVTVAEIETGIEGVMNEATLTGANTGINVVANAGKVELRTNNTGALATLTVDATSTMDDELGLSNTPASGTSGAAVATLRIEGKTEGVFSDSLTTNVVNATSGTASEFNLEILKDSVVVETFPNVTMDSSADRYVETIVNADPGAGGSVWVAAADLLATGTPTQRRPVNVSGSALVGGSDGLTNIDDNDFIGSSASSTGFRSFDITEEPSLLACPDRPTTAVQNGMTTYGEVTRNLLMVALLDPPTGGSGRAAIVSHRASLTATEHGVLYWPRIEIPNPSTSVFGTGATIYVNPSGSIAGRCARNDAEKTEGPFAQPANVEDGVLVGAVGVEGTDVLKEGERDIVFPLRINPIRPFPNIGVVVDGARTLKGDGNFPSVGERRGVSHIEATLKAGLEFARNRNNTSSLRSEVDRTIRLYLLEWTRRGAFASSNPAQAFFVDADIPGTGLNNAATRAANRLKVRIGLATAKPAEFIILSLSQDTRAIEEETLSP